MSNISKYTAQKRLTLVWFAGMALLIIIILIWMIGDKFPIEEIAAWVLQNMAPYITLITTTFIIRYTQKSGQSGEIDLFFYRLSLAISIFYIITLIALLMYIPIHEFEKQEGGIKDALDKSNKILIFFQSALSAVLGIFFVKKK